MLLLTLATLLFIATKAFGLDVPANHCEIFVDKVLVYDGPYKSKIITVWVKTLNERLDSSIEGVGFRHLEKVQSTTGLLYVGNHEQRARRHLNSRDYFTLDIPVSHADGIISYVGSFYVKTTKGTSYWLNTKEKKDFVLNQDTFNWLSGIAAKAPSATQSGELDYFNPDHCY